MKRSLEMAWMSYFILAFVSAGAVKLGLYAKDKIVNSKSYKDK